MRVTVLADCTAYTDYCTAVHAAGPVQGRAAPQRPGLGQERHAAWGPQMEEEQLLGYLATRTQVGRAH